MKHHLVLGLLLVTLLAACSKEPPKAKLAGEWVPQSAELGGKPFMVSNFAGATLRLTENSFQFGKDSGSYDVDVQSTPAQMNIYSVKGPSAEKDIPAIFKLEGNQLVVCYQLGEGERPMQFKTADSTDELLVRYRRK